MPIQHRCHACSTPVSEAQIQSGQGVRKGKKVYCAECSALILEPVAAAAQAAQMSPHAAPKGRRIEAGLDLSDPVEQAGDGIEVLEEYQIIAAAPTHPQMKAAAPAPAQAVRPASKPAALSRRSRGKTAMRRKGPGIRRASERAGAPAAQPRATAPKSMPKSSDSQREVFYKSSQAQPALAQNLEDLSDNTVDSNVLQSVQDSKDRKRRGAGRRGATRSSRRDSARGETRSSRRDSARGDTRTSNRSRRGKQASSGMSSQQMILIGVGCVVLLLILGFALASGNRFTAKRNTSGAGENLSATELVQRAQKKLSAGDKLGAADDYAAAAEAFDRMGNTSEAERYNQAAYGLRFKTAY